MEGEATERCRGAGDGKRADRIEFGSGEGGMEGETTVMGGGNSIEGTGTGEARSEPGMAAGVAPTLAGRAYGEAYGVWFT